MTECFNCHKKIKFSELVDMSYGGYEMLVCAECKVELENLQNVKS